ncbi:MAG TPA: 3-phosphoshikimate 1-carboxyvinyltransferase, partial [Candidatus Binataceae bacterium]|nr:3-phosphoshikimate 1-carboxyvinyltransferase [Candidatus Binataceae bacterium]
MDAIEITPVSKPFSAAITVPGSKSITNRALLIAALAQGRSVLDNVLFSDDTMRMIEALRGLGFQLSVEEDARRITVNGMGGQIPSSGCDLYIGGAGTAMRFLIPLMTLARGKFRIDGNQRMRERPIGPLLDAMQRLGASVYSERDNRCPPVIADSRAGFRGGVTHLDARMSSQFVSAMLMPAPLWPEGLRLQVAGEAARPFIEMTLRMMERWGVKWSIDGDTITIPGGQAYRARRFAVEPDASSASYFAAAAALCGGSVTLKGLSSNSVQGDIALLTVLQQMGARVKWNRDSVEITGTGSLRGVDVAMNGMPDMVATLAAIAPFATSATRIRKVDFIRHHESDRLRSIATELRRLGAGVTDFEDGLEILPSQLHGASIETYDDHRIAMAFAVVGLRIAGVK